MSNAFWSHDHILIAKAYHDPEPHRHLAVHLIFSTGSAFECIVNHTRVTCKAVCIQSNIMHTIACDNSKLLVFLFDNTSNLAKLIEQKYLMGEPYCPQKAVKILFKLRMKSMINFFFNLKMKKGDEFVKWGLMHGMYAYESKTPYEYMAKMNRYQIMEVAPLIDQDILIIGANQDHFINYRIVGEEIEALKNVRSLTVRIFTDKENAGAHCNVGNAGLVFNTMINWIEAIIYYNSKW